MKRAITTITIALILTLAIPVAVHGAKTTSLSFTNIPLLRPDGNSEPELSIGPDGTTVYVALSWTQFFTNTWKAGFGQAPVFQGTIDANLANNVGGGGDADVDIGSTGTLHVSTLIFFFNPQTRITQLGVSAITCPKADTSDNFSHCTGQIIDTTQSDRQWITSDGPHVYISYHDSGSSTLIHVQRSDDDGFTFHRVTDPITGQGGATGNSTFNNDQGKLIADSFSHNVAPSVHLQINRPGPDLDQSTSGKHIPREHSSLPMDRSPRQHSRLCLLRHKRFEQGRSNSCLERVHGSEHRQWLPLHAEHSHSPSKPRRRHMYQRNRLFSRHTKPARPFPGRDQPGQRTRCDNLHGRYSDNPGGRFRTTPGLSCIPNGLESNNASRINFPRFFCTQISNPRLGLESRSRSFYFL